MRLALALLLAFALPISAQANRPIILLVHGRGMTDRDTAATRKLWYDGLQSSASTVTRDKTIDESDVRVVWYADVLAPNSTESCDYSADDPRAKREARSDAGLKQVAQFAGGLLNVLSSLVDDKESASQLRAFSSDASFLGDAHKRCATEDRLAVALDRAKSEGRPVILVAHSLGSLVAYDYLTARSDSGIVREMITIGSPLGSPDMRRLLIGGDSTDALAKPRAVANWVNIRNEKDPLATSISVARDLVTQPPADESDPHEMIGYLRGSATAREILGAWCGAFTSKRPQGCKELTPN